MKLLDKLMIKLRLKQQKADKEIVELIKKQIKVQEQQQCSHPRLKELIPNDQWYRCTKCQLIMQITDAAVWDKGNVKVLTDNLRKYVLKEKKCK